MSKHLTSVSFQSTKGSIIHVEAELHHDIDYSIFDSSENLCEEKKTIKDNNKDKKKDIIKKLSNISLQGNGIKNKISEKEPNLSTSSTTNESDDYEDDFEDDDEEEEQKEENQKKDNYTSKAFDDDNVEIWRIPVVQEELTRLGKDHPVSDITSKLSQEDTDNNKVNGASSAQVPEEHLDLPKRNASKPNVELSSHDENNSKSVRSERTDSKKAKDKKVSVVRFNQTSIKKSSENISKQSPKMKDQHLKELMNCIAYNETKSETNTTSPSPDFLSVSTDTTSEITNVTTRPSSSGCSSLAKNDSVEDPEVQNKYEAAEGRRSKPSMKFLLETLNSLDRHKRTSMTPSITSLESKNGTKRRNMSFSNNQLWHIERENAILLRKLQELRKPSHKSLTRAQSVVYPRLSSSAINRRKQQQKINHENLILLRKIDEAKPTLPTRRSPMKT